MHYDKPNRSASISISGFLSKNPVPGHLPSGNHVVEFALPFNQGKKDDPNRLTEWYNFKAYGQMALYILENYKRGDVISISKTYRKLHVGKNGTPYHFWVAIEIDEPDGEVGMDNVNTETATTHPAQGVAPDDDVPY